VAWIELTVVVVVVVKVADYRTGAIWCATRGLGFVVYHLGCSTFVTVGEHRIVIRSYGTPVVIGVACCYVVVARCVSFCARPLLGTARGHFDLLISVLFPL